MKVLITEPDRFSEKGIERLVSVGHEVTCVAHTRDSLWPVIGVFDVLIVRLGIQLDREILKRARNLKYIVSPTTGIDHIDMQAAQDFGIEVISLHGETDFLQRVPATAELSFGLLLSVLRNIRGASESVLSGEWNRDAYVGHDVQGKTIGIIGLGRLGRMVARMGEAFGATIIYYDPYVKASSYKQVSSLLGIVSEADIVSIHVPLNDETRGMIDTAFFMSCSGQVFINTSRGAIVDEESLLHALEDGKISAAGLDVLTVEQDSSFTPSLDLITYAKDHTNLVITPHLGGATHESMRATELFVVNKLLERGMSRM